MVFSGYCNDSICLIAFESLQENTEHTLRGDYSNSTSMSEQTQLWFLHLLFSLCSSL